VKEVFGTRLEEGTKKIPVLLKFFSGKILTDRTKSYQFEITRKIIRSSAL